MIWFAEHILKAPLDPWQQWLIIHLGEMLDDGRPRFRQVLVIVARQNGKTHLCTVLALYWLFIERWPLTFGTSTDLEQAKDAWQDAVTLAEGCEVLAGKMAARYKKIGNGQQDFWSVDGAHYRIGAANPKGGRGKRIDRAIGDELREQHTWDAYLAAYNAMNARPRAQVVYITNMGDDRSVVLNQLRREALDAIAEPAARPVALFEWSAVPGSHPTDVHAHAAANPQYGRRMDRDIIISAGASVAKPGADPQKLTGFLTEILCLDVKQLDPAIDPSAWQAALRPGPLDTGDRDGLAVCVDLSPNLQHATLAAAQILEDGVLRIETAAEWSGPTAVAELRRDLPDWVRRIRPRALGWFPGGPAATVDADLRDRRKEGRHVWPPRGVIVSEISSDAAAACMAFAALVEQGAIVHSGQAMLTAQIEQAERLRKPDDRWVFTRRGTGNVDAVYAVAGAAHLARTLPTRRKIVRTAKGAG